MLGTGDEINFEKRQNVENPVVGKEESNSCCKAKNESDIELSREASAAEPDIDLFTRVTLVIFTAFVTIFFSGAVFGYGPMQLILESEGFYVEKCGVEEELPCPEQTDALLQITLISMLTLLFSPLFGAINDKFGPFFLTLVVTILGCIGLILLTVATVLKVDSLLYPAFVGLAFIAVGTTSLIIKVAILFPPLSCQRIISGLNALFDAGSMTYLFFWYLYDDLNVEFGNIVIGYLVFGVLCLGGTLLLWLRVRLIQKRNGLQPENDNNFSLLNNLRFWQKNEDENNGKENINVEDEKSSHQEEETKYIPIDQRSSYHQVTSHQFIFTVLFYAINSSKNVWTLSTSRDFLAYLGDDETGNRYLTIFTLLMPVSLVALPFMDVIVNKFGYYAGIQSINALSIFHGIIQVSFTNLDVQIFGFVIFSFFRCFLFSITFSFLPTFLSPKVLGVASGILIFIQAIFQFMNIPLATWAVTGLEGNFFVPNLLYTIFTAVIGVTSACKIGKGIEKEKEAKELITRSKS